MKTVASRLAQYVEECATLCPWCRVGRPHRLVGDVRTKIVDGGGRRLTVGCYCASCGAEWTEHYDLADATLNRHGSGEAAI